MSIIFEWNKDRLVIGPNKLSIRAHWQVVCLLANSITKPSDLMQLGKIVKTKWEKYTEPADVR